MCRPVFIGVLFACATAFAAAPKPKGDQGKKYLDAAIRLYNAFEFERALEQLIKARAQSTGAEMDVAIGLYEGIVELELGRDEAAETAFKTALSLDANAALPTKVSPKTQALFDRLKGEMAKALPPPPPPKEELKPPPPAETTPVSPVAVTRPPPARAPPGWWWAPAAGGAVFAAVGTVFLLQAKDRSDKLRSTGGDFELAAAEQYRSQGKTFQTLGFASIGLGVALIAVSAVIFFLVRS